MDITALAHDLTAFLTPLLPYLLRAGEKAAEEAGKKVGGEAWERAKTIWGKLQRGVEAKPDAREAMQKAESGAQDEHFQAAFQLQVKEILDESPALADEVGRMWDEARRARAIFIDSGERGVSIGGDVTSSTIITGDKNVV